jgi:hypothetical protein
VAKKIAARSSCVVHSAVSMAWTIGASRTTCHHKLCVIVARVID